MARCYRVGAEAEARDRSVEHPDQDPVPAARAEGSPSTHVLITPGGHC
jgi:hypothetical protein